MLLAGLAAWFCAGVPGSAVALEVNAGADLDYGYIQENQEGEVNASTTFKQRYILKYVTSLTTAHDFIGAVGLDLEDAWYTDDASTSRAVPSLELATKGSQIAAAISYEAVIDATDAYLETGAATLYSDSLSFNLELTPAPWPEVKLKLQRGRVYQENFDESTTDTFEFSARKEIYGVRLEFNFQREETESVLPTRTSGTGTGWSAKATYKEILWGGTEFELTYEITEDFSDERIRGVLTSESSTYDQSLKTRLKKSLVIGPRLTLGLAWEYQFEQDLLALDFDYKVKNNYTLDLRWDTFDWLKISSVASRVTDRLAAVDGEEDTRSRTDSFKVGFDFTSISWLRVSGNAQLKSDGKLAAGTGGSLDKVEEEKYELIAKNRFGEFWDLTVNAATSNTHTDDVLTNRDTKVKADLKLKFFGLAISPAYEVSRTNKWEPEFDFPTSQIHVRDAKIKFEYQVQLLDMVKASFSHDYGYKIEDSLDEVLDFERVLQFNEDTRLTVSVAEIVRNVRVDGEVSRKASDTEGDPDPELVELAYSLKLDWKLENLSLLSSFKYNDKGDTSDDLSFNLKVNWKRDRLELSGEYTFDKVITDITEPKDEHRQLNLKLNYKF